MDDLIGFGLAAVGCPVSYWAAQKYDEVGNFCLKVLSLLFGLGTVFFGLSLAYSLSSRLAIMASLVIGINAAILAFEKHQFVFRMLWGIISLYGFAAAIYIYFK